MANIIFKLLRTDHYIKNLVIFIPLFFLANLINLQIFLETSIIFIAFCITSSAVYIINDLFDIEFDRKHPIKCNRPIASGKISKKNAIIISFILISFGLFLSHLVDFKCFLIVLSYLVLNIFYSAGLKNIILIDSACIAFGFILRIIAGYFALKEIPSPLIILITFFISQFFIFSKRKFELQWENNSSNLRKSISGIDIAQINTFIFANSILSIAFYAIYVFNEKIAYNSPYLYLTIIPFVLIIYRMILLVDFKNIEDEMISYIKRDKILYILFAIYLTTLFITLTILK